MRHITCDRCARPIHTERLANDVALVKWASDSSEDRIVKSLARFDLCDECLNHVERAVVKAVRGDED